MSQLPKKDNWVVEFGACDGYEFSNTIHLIEAGNINAVLKEPQDHFFNKLTEKMKIFKSALHQEYSKSVKRLNPR